MDRRSFLGSFGVLAVAPLAGLAPGPEGSRKKEKTLTAQERDFEPLEKTEEEWRRILTEDEFAVLRKDRTEPAHSSPLDKEYRPGTFICAGCFLPLFSSEAKFDSGTGWPSFTQPLEGHMDTKLDFKLVWPRTEYHCARCGGHQGHVFKDGPAPTGERWCNNGVALDFVPRGETLPELRR